MILHYKCQNCGDDMAFETGSGTLSCQSCGRQDTIENFDEEYITTTFSEDEAREYHCDNCGADIITDADTTATSCSFCGAGVVLADRVSGALAPSKVIPFKISKDEAKQAFKKWCKNGLLTPAGFMSGNRVKEITGIYVPFWMYDLNSRVKVNGTGTRVRTYSRGDYIYTETKFYDVYRDIDLNYKKVPVDASEKMNDELMDKVEPYNYEALKDFKTPYLAGYLAEKYNFTDEQLFSRVKSKIQRFIDSYVSSTVSGYSSVSYRNKDVRTRKRRSYYVLLPVWMVYYDYDKQEHTFAMNGQTGKVVGKPPISSAKVAAWFGGIAGSIILVMKSISFILGGGFW
ncbi:MULTISPECIES: hypothetical protein [Bacillaceae]|uniref:TFIIB-type zinc ribbon-containing protein n=1 Tax=Evansella alkalicola TaxID=745819 RepID=A0ABS6JWQ3_9BACI|nr:MULTISPECIES: hypothetical protein [Bacillaceae]MBU9722991.1 TFIIB-type zinc ribbon-containing protein [Bacillus alkalicola]